MLLKRKKHLAGYSLVEVIFATSIVTTSLYAGFAGLKYLNNFVAARKEFSRETNLAMTVIATVAANPAMFPPSDEFFGEVTKAGETIVPPGLKNPYYAYGPLYFGPASECEQCPNRIGVATRAVPNSPRTMIVDAWIFKVKKGKTTEYVKVKKYTSAVSF